MKSKVYFVKVDNSDDKSKIKASLKRLLAESGILSFLSKNQKTALKIHFGEEGNTGYVNPEYVRVIADGIIQRGAGPFLTDTNTLYHGRRINSQEHLKLAYEHGFSSETVNCSVVIPDDTQKENISEIEINQEFVKTAKIARLFIEADALIGIAHFKGHLMTGFGGALKNIGMGCASRKGKLFQHADVSPIVHIEQCIGCEACAAVCPVGAIKIINKKAVLDRKKCIGCASCLAACKYWAIDVEWESGGDTIQEKMIEYVKAVLQGKENCSAFLNFAIKITKECDCLAKDDPRICPDIGILASYDPVSIDKASYDLVVQACGRDIFKEVHSKRDGMKQLQHAAKLGLGNLDYELIDLS